MARITPAPQRSRIDPLDLHLASISLVGPSVWPRCVLDESMPASRVQHICKRTSGRLPTMDAEFISCWVLSIGIYKSSDISHFSNGMAYRTGEFVRPHLHCLTAKPSRMRREAVCGAIYFFRVVIRQCPFGCSIVAATS